MIRSISLLLGGAAVGAISALLVLDRAADQMLVEASPRLQSFSENQFEQTEGFVERGTDPSATSIGRAIELANRVSEFAITDLDTALAQLGAIESPVARRATALAVVEVLGYDPDAVEIVAAKLPASEALNFKLDAIAAQSELDPDAALQAALTLDRLSSREQAIVRIAHALTMVDPQAGIALSTSLHDDDLASAFQSQTLSTWATFDPDGVFSYLESGDLSRLSTDSPALFAIAAVAPERLLAFADQLPRHLRLTARSAALENIAQRDVSAAISLLDSMPSDDTSTGRWAEVIAGPYARQDPAGAVTWATSLSEAGRRSALHRIASIDPMSAINYFFDEIEGRRETTTPTLLSSALGTMLNSSGTTYAEIASVYDRIVEVGETNQSALMDSAVAQWIRRDTESAIAWMLSDPGRLSRGVVRSASVEIGGMGSQRASQLLDRIPQDQKALWMGDLATGMAARDFRGALTWISRYEGQPGYDDAVAGVLSGAAASLNVTRGFAGGNPPRGSMIAEFLDATEPGMRARYAPQAAGEWAARENPAAAADWALNLDLAAADEQSRLEAIANVATQWTARDANAATTWVLGLPVGATRDAAIGRVIWGMAESGVANSALLGAFSSDAMRQQALLSAMITFGQSDPELGRTLIDSYFINPTLREQAEQALVTGSTSQPSSRILTVR